MPQATQMLIGLDLETTGTCTATDDPVQMAAVYVVFDSGVASSPKVLFNGYCNPSVPIHPEAQEVHGISPEMVRYATSPKVAAKTMAMLIDQVGTQGEIVTIGYNSGSFDVPMLSRFDSRYAKHKHIDVYSIVLRELYTHGLKLTEMYENYIGKEPGNSHDAAADVFLTLEILLKYIDESGKTVHKIHEELLIPTVYKVFPFGKYKGKSVDAIPPSYAKWCLKNFDNIAPDLHLTLKYISEGDKK